MVFLFFPYELRASSGPSITNWTDRWLAVSKENPFYKSLQNCTNPDGKPKYYGDFFQNLYPLVMGKTISRAQEKRATQHVYTNTLVTACRSGTLSTLKASPCDELNRHYIWINNPEAPSEPRPETFNHLIGNIKKSGANLWNYHFWTNIVCDRTIQYLQELATAHGVNIHVHDVDTEIYPQMRGKAIYNRLLKNRYFTNMSDILRFNIIHSFGRSENTFNIYSDLHVEDHEQIAPLTPYIDHLFYQEGFAVGSCMLGGRKGSKVYNGVLEYIDDLPNKISAEWRGFGSDVLTPRWTSIGMLTMMMDKFSDPESRILPCPKGTIMSPNHTAGWLKGDYGQTSVREHPISDAVFFGTGDFILSHPPYAVLDHAYHKDYIDLAQLLHAERSDGTKKTREEHVEELRQKRLGFSATSRDIYTARTPKETPVIPSMHHRIWLAKEGAGAVEPDPLMVRRYVDSVKMLPKEFRNIFWCTDRSAIPQTVTTLEKAGIEVREVGQFFEEIQHDPSMLHEQDSSAAKRPIILGKHVYDVLRQDERNTNANDVLRRLILIRYGGIYTDMGFRFERDISPLMKLYDYIFYLYSWQNIDHGLCATRPQDPLFKKELEFIHNLWRHPKKAAMKSFMPTPLKQLMLTGSHSFMNHLDLNTARDSRILFLPAHEIKADEAQKWRVESNSYVSLVRGRSWNGIGNPFNNVPIQTSSLDILAVTPTRTYCYRWPHETPNQFGAGNIGEYLFSDAARRLVGADTVSTDDFKRLRQEDTYLVVASNVLNSSENSAAWANRVLQDVNSLKPGIPVVVMCMGAQATDTETDITIHSKTLELLRAIQKRRLHKDKINIGVRGTYTQSQLARFGIQSEVVGCPSLLYQQLPAESLMIPRDPKKLAVAATFYSSNPTAQLGIMEIAARYDATYFIQTEQSLVNWLKTPSSHEQTMSMLTTAASTPGSLTYEQKGFVNLFQRAGKPGLGYFEKFVSQLREKSVLPQNTDQWINYYQSADGPNFIVTTRIHGTVPALLAGKRALLIAHDSRTAELAETLGIPSLKELNSAWSIEKLYELAEPKKFIERYQLYTARMYEFLTQNGVVFYKPKTV